MKKETDQLRSDLAKIKRKLSTLTTDQGESAKSIDHCTLQCDYWRLTFALATYEVDEEDDKKRSRAVHMLRLASKEAESWEQRRQVALKGRESDTWEEILRKINDMEAQGAALEDLS